MEDVVDFDNVAPEDRAELRKGLIDQLAYLVQEVAALKTVVDAVPEDVQAGRPTGEDLTMKEIYGLIATLDGEVRGPVVEAIADGASPPSVPADPPRQQVRRDAWNARDIQSVLDAVQDARRRFVEALNAVPPDDWTQTIVVGGEPITLFEWTHRIAEADLERLRDLGYRLHDADLSDRSTNDA
jgi:hypothetical protein